MKNLNNIKKRLNKIIFRIIYVVGFLLYLLIFIEIVLFIFDFSMSGRVPFQYDKDFGLCVKPYAKWGPNKTNRFGFNDKDYPLKKVPDKYRILIIGDSFNWAGYMNGNYTTLLENKFLTYCKNRVEIINIGYPCTTTDIQLKILKKYGLLYNPDMVILAFFVGNDFNGGNRLKKRIIVNGALYFINKQNEIIIMNRAFILKSRLYLLLKQKIRVYKEKKIARRENKNGSFSLNTFLSIEYNRLEFCNIDKHKKGLYKNDIDYILDNLSEMDKLLKSKRIKFIVATYPDEFQVNNKLYHQIISKYNLNPANYQLNLPQKLVENFCKLNKIEYLDLLNIFKNEGKKTILYIPRNTHWNYQGNKLAAQILFKYLFPKIKNYLNLMK